MGPQEAESDEQGIRPCYCGSGKPSYWMDDAYGAPQAKVCEDCNERIVFAYGYEIIRFDTDDDDDQELVDMIDTDSLQEDES